MKSFYIIALLASAAFTSGLVRSVSAQQDSLPAAAQASNPSSERAEELLDEIASAENAQARQAAADKLIALRPVPVDWLRNFLERDRSTPRDQRRPILVGVGAEVPDDQGRFRTPGRATKKSEKEMDEFDWLAELAEAGNPPGIGELWQDIAVIRALAASRNPEAGHVILGFAFSEKGLIYRDECGRHLRKMSPYSLPALMHGSQERRKRDIRRYANYQLERLDRQNPAKAFAAAPTEELQIALMTAFAEAQVREAVFVVLDNVDHVAPRVRRATREAWMEFVAGKPPRKPPERKLELPRGELSEEEEPLWLDHRQLADVAIRKRLEKLSGEAPPKSATLPEMSEALFAHYDNRRAQVLLADLDAGLALSEEGRHDEATALFDRILVQAPEFAKRDAMASAYFSRAAQLEKQGDWKAAAVAYGKANAVDPDGPKAVEALSKHHYARAKAAEAAGEDASTEFAMASELDEGRHARGDSRWILFGGIVAIGCSIALLLYALYRRRAAMA